MAFIRENSFIHRGNDDDQLKEEDLGDEDYEELKLNNCPLVNAGTGEEGNIKYFSRKPPHNLHGKA